MKDQNVRPISSDEAQKHAEDVLNYLASVPGLDEAMKIQRDQSEPLPQPTFSHYDPAGLKFQSGDEVVGFWFIENSIKYHLAIDKDGREYETTEEPVKC